eukprot:m.23341 g.23341  ORF g.23341 m.23341 type:complete len:376 (+) comp7491_c0_seq1:213-1340(+)
MGGNPSKEEGEPDDKPKRRGRRHSRSFTTPSHSAGVLPTVLVIGADKDACEDYISHFAQAYHTTSEEILWVKPAKKHLFGGSIGRRSKRAADSRAKAMELFVQKKAPDGAQVEKTKSQTLPRSRSPSPCPSDASIGMNENACVRGATVNYSSALKVHIRYIPIEELERVLKYGLPKRYTAQGEKEKFHIRGLQFLVPVFKSTEKRLVQSQLDTFKDMVKLHAVQEHLMHSCLLVMDVTMPNRESTLPRKLDIPLMSDDSNEYDDIYQAWGVSSKPLDSPVSGEASNDSLSSKHFQFPDHVKDIVRHVTKVFSSEAENANDDKANPSNLLASKIRLNDYYTIKCAAKKQVDIIKADIMREVVSALAQNQLDQINLI